MGGHHDHHDTYKIPHHTIYKVEDSPRLMKVQEKLAAEGLKDPWIRNEVFRYKYDVIPMRTRIYEVCGGRFMLYGIGLGILGAVAQYAWDQTHPAPNHGGGHH
ncbi:NADH-dehydrogenase (ubiquinone) 1 beta-subcomplex 3-like [Tropilaelaps mercedesae]|uniref:NADH-dehydrogenase (Ubiquinone) 1 beta-subcomplex 3-like n=1 Tax=Tropilaelaps mercedesae TaxID=418985 RepID=A0A1V9X3A2_9ACAR|nr:NADH-dehydrogenase (ubiquinone) 1 beta-subcomplex 3-like [Tropilaelaps mercedesae]